MKQAQDDRVDVRTVLSTSWIATLSVFASVDIFGFFRADILKAALDGTSIVYALSIIALHR